jgi:2-oxoisovalerate dehydrogenase E2 component (dihydrolipoyl transacylase)
MSVKQFNLPDLGEGLTEGEIIKWLVSVGDTIELNQPIVEVETAKAAVEIPAKWGGRVEAIFHTEGETVDVGTPIIAIETDPAGSAGSSGGESAAPAEETTVLVGYGPRAGSVKRRPRRSDAPAATASAPPAQPVAPAPLPAPEPTAEPAAGVLAKPPVRKLARDLGVDLYTITGTGPQGSITRDDVQAAAAPAAGAPGAETPAAAVPVFGPDREQRIPIRGVRKLTAENMVASAFTAPHVTEFLTVDVTRSMKALDRLRRQPEWQDVRISPLLLVAKAALLAIGRHPLVNSTWSEATGEIVVKEYVNLGIAAATERGLIVPNVKDAGRLSLRDLADALTGLVQTAKAGKTPPADMSGGTFTITNVGVFGVDAGTPILPPGEAAILAFGAVREAPWAHRGKVRIRQVTTLSLSFDHRIVDGELGSHFLRDIGRFLSDPETMLLSWC